MSLEQAQSSEQASKFCINCEYIATSHQGWEQFKCRAPQNKVNEYTNLVTGDQVIIWRYQHCEDARILEKRLVPVENYLVKELDACGREATWFKQKEHIPIIKEYTTPKAGGKPPITVDMI